MRYIFLSFLIIFTGCTTKTSLLPQAQNIQTTNEKPKNCKMLGEEIGQKVDTMGSMSLLELRESSMNDLKNKASKLGGDTLYILNMERGKNSLWEAQEYLIEAEVYLCEKP